MNDEYLEVQPTEETPQAETMPETETGNLPEWLLESEELPQIYTFVEVPRPFLTTSFEDYNVTEGFLLLFLACAFIGAIYHMIRRFV